MISPRPWSYSAASYEDKNWIRIADVHGGVVADLPATPQGELDAEAIVVLMNATWNRGRAVAAAAERPAPSSPFAQR